MAVNDTVNQQIFSGDAATSVWPVTDFKVFEASHIRVIIKNTTAATLKGIAAGAFLELTYSTDFTVALASSTDLPTAPTVTITNSLYTSLAVGLQMTVLRELPQTQLVNLRDNQGTPAATYEGVFDRAVMLIQGLAGKLKRALKFADGSTQSDLVVAEPIALKYLQVNAAGNGIQMGTPSVTTTAYGGSFSFGLDASKAASPTSGDIYFAVDTNKWYKCLVGGTWTTAANFADVVAFSGAALNFAKGADIASATTTDIGAATGNYVTITGTTTITGLGTVQAGTHRWVRFSGALTLTHNATSLILPGGQNITTAAGDCALFISEGSGNWRCQFYQKASGLPIISGLPKNYIDGGIPSLNGSDPTNDLDFTACVCRSDDDTEDISVAALTKRIDAAWAAGTNQGMMDTSTIGASEDLIYIFAIKNPTTGATDFLATKTKASPTMPSGYTKKRFIKGLRWDGAKWLEFYCYGNGRVIDTWYHDANAAGLALGSTTSTSFGDFDGGDGGNECIPSSAIEAFVGFDVRSDSSSSGLGFWRPNGSAGAGGDYSGIITVDPAGANPRCRVSIKVPVDADGIFEVRAGAASSTVAGSCQGYREVR